MTTNNIANFFSPRVKKATGIDRGEGQEMQQQAGKGEESSTPTMKPVPPPTLETMASPTCHDADATPANDQNPQRSGTKRSRFSEVEKQRLEALASGNDRAFEILCLLYMNLWKRYA